MFMFCCRQSLLVLMEIFFLVLILIEVSSPGSGSDGDFLSWFWFWWRFSLLVLVLIEVSSPGSGSDGDFPSWFWFWWTFFFAYMNTVIKNWTNVDHMMDQFNWTITTGLNWAESVKVTWDDFVVNCCSINKVKLNFKLNKVIGWR